MISSGSSDKSLFRTSLDVAMAFRNLVIPPAVDDPRTFFRELAKTLRKAFRARLVVIWDNNVYTRHLVRLSADPDEAEGFLPPVAALEDCLAGLAVERSDIVEVSDIAQPRGTRQPPARPLVDQFEIQRLISLPIFSPFNQQFVCLVADLCLDKTTRPPNRTGLSLLSQVLSLCFDYVLYQLDHRVRSAVEQAMAGAAGISGLFERVYPNLAEETRCLSASLFTLDPTTGVLKRETSRVSGLSTPQSGGEAEREWERTTQIAPELTEQVIGRRSAAMVFTPLCEARSSALMFAPIMTVSGDALGVLRCRGPIGAGTSFSTADMHVLEMLARSLGPCVERFLRVRTGSGLMNVVREVSTRASGARKIDDVLQQTIATTVRVLNAEVGSVYLLDSDTGGFVLRASVGYSRNLVGAARYTLGEGLTGTIGQGEVLNLKSREEVVLHPDFKGKHDEEIWGEEAVGCETFLGVPIRAEGRVMGVLKVSNLRPSPEHPDPYFTDEDVETALVLSTFLAYEIENARQRDLAAARYDSLTRSSVAIEGAQTEEDAISEAMAALEQSGIGNAMLSLYRPETGMIEGIVAAGPGWNSIVDMTKRDINGDDILALVLRQGTPVFIADSREDRQHCAQDAVEKANLKAQYVIPLRLGEEMIGTLQVDMGDRDSIEPDEERVTQAFAGHLALAISRLRNIRKSVQLAEDVMSRSRFVVAEALSAMAVHSLGHRVDQMLKDVESALARKEIRENRYLLQTMQDWEAMLQSAEEDLRKALGLVSAPETDDEDSSVVGPTDVQPQIQETIDMWFGFVSTSRVRITSKLEAVQSTCDISDYAFREIVSVLLVNSIQAYAKRIHIRTYNQHDVALTPNYSVRTAFCLDFADDGIGVAAGAADKIFGARYTTKPRKFGTGLGLFIARRLARTGGGDLTIVGKGIGDKGVTFRLVLRVTRTEEEL